MKTKGINLNQNRMISNLFTPSFIKKHLINDNGVESIFQKIERYYDYDQRKKLKNIYSDLYSELLNNYKCEYVFKNELFKILLNKYHLNDVVFFDEFKINSSIADLVCFNGIITVYEIKTNLDSLEKLEKQICNYKTIANKIFVVTTSYFYKKIISKHTYDGIGIIIMNEDNSFSKARECEYELELDKKSLFKLLLKKEVNELMLYNFGFIPDTPNTIFLRYCYTLLENIDSSTLQKQIINKIKRRKINNIINKKEFQNIPNELKYIFYNLDMNINDLEVVNTNLNYKKRCIHHMLEVNNLNY